MEIWEGGIQCEGRGEGEGSHLALCGALAQPSVWGRSGCCGRFHTCKGRLAWVCFSCLLPRACFARLRASQRPPHPGPLLPPRRVGRTARAGRPGWSLSFVTQYDIELVQRIEGLVGQQLDRYEADEAEVLKGITKVGPAGGGPGGWAGRAAGRGGRHVWVCWGGGGCGDDVWRIRGSDMQWRCWANSPHFGQMASTDGARARLGDSAVAPASRCTDTPRSTLDSQRASHHAVPAHAQVYAAKRAAVLRVAEEEQCGRGGGAVAAAVAERKRRQRKQAAAA
jgi:hypothetical protein